MQISSDGKTHGYATNLPMMGAKGIEPGTFDGVWFRCLKHREFGVSYTALKRERTRKPEQWERALKKAIGRASAERPKITEDDFL